MKIYALSLAIGLLIANGAIAAESGGLPSAETCKEVQTVGSPNCCAHCGAHACCDRYCRIVCEMKEVKKIVWAVKCEEFCPLMPGCNRDCNDCCDNCGKEGCRNKSCNPCAELESRKYVTPTCGKVRERKILEKKEVICKVPVYKCVVTYGCGNCGSKGSGEKVDPQAPTPAPAPPASKTTQFAPLPPVVGTSFVK